jgi:hypothetical protein
MAKTANQDDKFGQVWDTAKLAAQAACQAAANQYFKGNDGGACGFAWVTVRPATGPFINWCKKQAKLAEAEGDRWRAHKFGSKAWNGGWQFWDPGEWGGQSVDVKEAGAVAFRNVLAVELGLNVEVGSRLD